MMLRSTATDLRSLRHERDTLLRTCTLPASLLCQLCVCGQMMVPISCRFFTNTLGRHGGARFDLPNRPGTDDRILWCVYTTSMRGICTIHGMHGCVCRRDDHHVLFDNTRWQSSRRLHSQELSAVDVKEPEGLPRIYPVPLRLGVACVCLDWEPWACAAWWEPCVALGHGGADIATIIHSDSAIRRADCAG